MASANNISIFVKSQFPNNFNVDGQTLVKFVETYYEWLGQYENPVYSTRKLLEYADVDRIPDKFFDFIRNEFMKNIPAQNSVDDRLLLKHIKDFYRSKGTEKSFNLLFRVLYNEDITFYYPGQDMLRASAGKWIQERSIKTKNFVSNIEDYILIKGISSGATARIDRSVSYFEGGIEILELYLKNIRGTFESDEGILDYYTDELIATNTTALITYDGFWQGTDGFLSWDKYLQDNFYYQDFSYVIRSNQNINTYREPVTNLVHPAGTKLFGELSISQNIDYASQLQANFLSTIDMERDYEISVDAGISFGFGYADIDAMYTFEMVADVFDDVEEIPGLSDTIDIVSGSGTGKIDVLKANNFVSSYYNVPMSDFSGFEIASFTGQTNLIRGHGTAFKDILSTGDIISVLNSNGTFEAVLSKISSHRWAMMRDPHSYGTVENKDYNYFTLPSINVGIGTVDVLMGSEEMRAFFEETLEEIGDLPLYSFNGYPVIVHGIGTAFTFTFNDGDTIEILNSNGVFRSSITKIVNNEYLILGTPHTYGTVSGKTYKYYTD